MSDTILNPILPGFHPDPSILRIGSDYYIATSTFEWWPGVRIHHSKDLVNWHHAAYALTRTSQLDMIGNPDSAGIWAPCLSYRDGLFYVVYTNVRTCLGAYKDTHNYFVTAKKITGPWSEPTYLTSIGFDPSFFHDDDGRTWYVSMKWDHRQKHNPFPGIFLQEYSHSEKRLIGKSKLIFKGSKLMVTEGPHIYKRNGWYYLLVAEGGTFYSHAATLTRSRKITGPYQISPYHPLLTSYKKPRHLLQRAGHASLVETQNGQWYLAHLCGRPLEWRGEDRNKAGGYDTLHCPLGRETAIQAVQWTDDDWLRLSHGTNTPEWTVAAPKLKRVYATPKSESEIDDFDSLKLSPHFNSLRRPVNSNWLSLKARKGFLRLYGHESFSSVHNQSLIARRLDSFKAEASTAIEFSPKSFQQMAGLVVYYNSHNHAYLYITHDKELGRILTISKTDRNVYSEIKKPVSLDKAKRVWLKVVFDQTVFRFFYALTKDAWHQIGQEYSMAFISDENATNFTSNTKAFSFGFTGTYIGLACQDFTGGGMHADFDYFSYRSFPTTIALKKKLKTKKK
ncbi:MAG: glycoside hydrolase family 43 protein [Deltaproteobacteria bacterium]|nr:glycoside hydrolase family 43 protein [Deltaproteobacteria bacterium]